MTDKEKGRPLWASFTVGDGKEKLNISFPPGFVGDYTDKVGQELDPDEPEEKAIIEDLQSTARAFRIAKEQINPDRLKETAQHMRENMPLVDLMVPAFLHHLLEPFRDKVENGDGTETIDFDIENPPEWYDPSKTYDINADKAIERATNAVRAYVEETQDFWEDTAEYVWVHLMAHTLLEMVNKYGGWDELLELPDLEDQFNKWLLEDEHMGPFADRYEDIVKMYADIKAHQMAEAIEGEGDLLMAALAFEPVPDHGHLSDIEGMVHTDNSRPYHETVTAIAAGKGQFQGEEWPVAPLSSGGQLVVYPPYEDFNPSLLSPEELAQWQAKMQDIVYDMNDLTADMLDIATIAHLESKTKSGHFFNLDLNEVLKMRGIEPKRNERGYTSGYRPEDYALIRRHIAKLCYIRPEGVEQEVTMLDEKGRRDRKRIAYRHPLLVIGGEKTVQDVESGLYEERTLELRLSPLFAEKLASISPQIALMPKLALECHPQKQWLEKRLIRQFTHWWRNRQQTASYTDPVTVGHLLEKVGLEIPDRNQHRTRERLEKALDYMVNNGGSGGWQYVGWDESRADRRGWVKEWKQARIMVEPPGIIPDYYRERIADKAPEKVKKQRRPKGQKKAVSDVGNAIHEKRTREGLSMSQLAEQLGVSPSQISRWEAGRTKPRGKAMKRVQEWLGGGQA